MAGYGACGCGRRRPGGLDLLLAGLAGTLDAAREAEALAEAPGFLQRLDPRFKLAGLLLLILAATLARTLTGLGLVFVIALALAAASGIGLGRLIRRVWLGVLLFSGLIALPALVLVPGEALWRLPLLGWPVTLQGLRSAAFLLGRAETAATLGLLLVLTTPWPQVLKALRALGVPAAAVAVLGMTQRYILLLLESAAQMAEARRARLVAPVSGATARRIALASLGALFARSLALAGEVHLAMVARGWRGEVRLLDSFRAAPRDWAALAVAAAVPATLLGLGG